MQLLPHGDIRISNYPGLWNKNPQRQPLLLDEDDTVSDKHDSRTIPSTILTDRGDLGMSTQVEEPKQADSYCTRGLWRKTRVCSKI